MAGTPPHFLGGGLGHLTNALPLSGWASPVIYLCIYLFIYLLFYLISCPHAGTVWLPQLDWEVREPGRERTAKAIEGCPLTPSTPSWGAREQPHPRQRLKSLGKGTHKKRGDYRLLTLTEGVGGEVSGGPVMGRVPAFLSLPLPLQETGERSLLICFLFTPLLEGPQVPGTD